MTFRQRLMTLLYRLCSCLAGRGGAERRTRACMVMCKKFEEKGYVTRTFLVSPTRESNTLFNNLSTLQKCDTCDRDEYSTLFLKYVMDEVKNDWEEYESYKKFRKALRKQMENKPLTLDEEYLLEEKQHRTPTKVKRPGHMLLVDDCQVPACFSERDVIP